MSTIHFLNVKLGDCSVIKHNSERVTVITRARILLKADADVCNEEIKEAVEVSIPTIERVRKVFALEGLRAALEPKKRSDASRPRKFDGEKEAHLIALACSAPPEGHCRWTLRLLAETLVELEHFSSISHEAIRQVLKKTNSNRG